MCHQSAILECDHILLMMRLYHLPRRRLDLLVIAIVKKLVLLVSTAAPTTTKQFSGGHRFSPQNNEIIPLKCSDSELFFLGLDYLFDERPFSLSLNGLEDFSILVIIHISY